MMVIGRSSTASPSSSCPTRDSRVIRKQPAVNSQLTIRRIIVKILDKKFLLMRIMRCLEATREPLNVLSVSQSYWLYAKKLSVGSAADNFRMGKDWLVAVSMTNARTSRA